MNSLHVFVDEYGDSNLDVEKAGVSTAYIVCAVCVRSEMLEEVRAEAESFRRRHFQSGEIKSSSVGSNDNRRIDLLNKLSSLDLFVIALCADKRRADQGSGLRFKRSFLKFFASRMYERLVRYSDDLVVVADQHGSPEFQEEFKRYLSTRFADDLFPAARFDFADSKDEVLLQVSDMFAGSLARFHDESKVSSRLGEIQRAIKGRVSLTLWPSGSESLQIDGDQIAGCDEEIRRFCIRAVENYLAANTSPDDLEELARITFLEALLSSHAWGDFNGYVSTGVLLKEISRRLGEPITEHKFRSSVVARLRDLDIVIASCSRGYKIPATLEDVKDYAHFANSILPPMVARVERARRGVREATMGKIDVLDGVELDDLKRLVEAIAQNRRLG